MKKKFLILYVAILLLLYIYRALIKRNVLRIPLGLIFFTPNGSYVNLRTIIHEPGK